MDDQNIDYLSLKEASEYIGVSQQTLRRWDKVGKLKPVRHPANGYRFYKRADLEPFRLEYQRAQTSATEDNSIFASLPIDIQANPKLREPQKHGHAAVKKHFAKENEHAILQIPVGCGKTGLISILPFEISNGRTLVITPNLTIRNGVATALDISNPNNFWRKSGVLHDFSNGPFRAVLDGVDANLHDCNDSDFVVTNIQQLANSADRWLPQFPPNYFDMILVDEGHHNVAPSWAKVFERFPSAKVVSLTATPFRGDGVRPIGKVIYRYPFTRAMVNGYIKQIHSRNVAPSELYFTSTGSVKRHTLEEVMELREEAWFRRGVALSPECNMHIVEASLKYLSELRATTNFPHQIIGAACSVDHARQIRSLYRERGLRADEIHSDMDRDKQDAVIEKLRTRRLDCVVQVQMLGEGFDHPPLSVAAIFRPFRSLSPYIQFVGRVMRVVTENSADDPNNHAYIVSHVGLNNDEHWDDFREIDFDDQKMIRQWINENESDSEAAGEPRPRRFDDTLLVDNEIIGDFISKSYLDPDDDRVISEFLNKEIGVGIKLGEILSKEELRKRLSERRSEGNSGFIPPIQPQRRRVELRKRLNERAKSVANRVLSDLSINGAGREIGAAIKSVRGQANRTAILELINRQINKHLNISKRQRDKISSQQAEDALAALDLIGDRLRDEIGSNMR